jgi:hypothetical protein
MSDEWTIQTNSLPLGDEERDYHVGYHYKPGLINDDVIDDGLKPDSHRDSSVQRPGFFHPARYSFSPSVPPESRGLHHSYCRHIEEEEKDGGRVVTTQPVSLTATTPLLLHYHQMVLSLVDPRAVVVLPLCRLLC